ncbi:MAG: pyruvate dehydrogenase (acetyl-transferring) E1 component subunit alpha [Dehalococcoidia bacterium]
MVETAASQEAGAPHRDTLIAFYRQMVLIRRFEEAAAVQYQRRKIGGFLHLYIGEEAVAVGAVDTLLPQDTIVAHYREHGHALARGADPNAVMAELFGRATGVSKGKGGSMHLYDAGRGFLGGYAIVAGHLPIAVGLAMAHKHRNDNGICLAFFGDGAVNEGEFHEALNLAAVWKTPVLFLCENNLYGMGTALERAAAVPEVYKRARAYDIPAERCNGMDVREIHAAATKAAGYVRTEKKPYLLEAMCYRFRGHSMADPELYREKDEVARWRERDPITRLRSELLENGQATDEELNAIDAAVEQQVDEAVRFADASPEPAAEELWTDVYVGVARESHHA